LRKWGASLPGRKNIILTRQENLKIEGAVVVKNLEEAIHEASTSEQAFIIGGAELYREALPYVKNIYLTIIHKYFEGDAKFPKLNFESEFRIISKENHDSPDLKYSFLVAERI
jgi:dihydrofolate reductase